jgi:hypothetical protein
MTRRAQREGTCYSSLQRATLRVGETMLHIVRMIAVGAMIASLTGGCATVTSGKDQTLSFDTDPAGADCTLVQSGVDVARFKTPKTLSVRRANSPLIVACSKPGYQQTRAMIASTISAGAWGNLIVGGLIGVMVDQSSGAAFRYYDPPRLVLLSASDAPPEDSRTLAAGVTLLPPTAGPTSLAAAATSASAPAPSPLAPAGPAAPPTPSAYDGDYSGRTEILQTNVSPPVPRVRLFDVRVVNGVGVGTVKHVLCDEPGEVFFSVSPAGEIRGRANTRNTTGCTDRLAMIEGRVEGDTLRLTLHLRNNPALVLARTGGAQSPSVAAVPAPPSRPADGEYNGGVELAAGDLLQIWFRIKGAKSTGTVRAARCSRPGALAFSIDPAGVVSGEADLLGTGACNSRKSIVEGHVEGSMVKLIFTLDGGAKSREFSFQRRAVGAGVAE